MVRSPYDAVLSQIVCVLVENDVRERAGYILDALL